MQVRWMVALALSIALGLSGTAARAQTDTAADEEARALFQAGRVAYARGRYEQALERFQKAYALSGRHMLLFNIANALDRLRRDDEALEALLGFVAALPDHPQAAHAKKRIAALEQAIEQRRRAGVPSPAEAARGSSSGRGFDMTAAGDDGRRRDGAPLVKRWWLWTAVGGAVAGAIVGIAVAASRGGSSVLAEPVPYDAHTRNVPL